MSPAGPPSIRRLTAVTTVAFGVIALFAMAALIWISGKLETSITTVIRSEQGRATSSNVELSLLTFQRLSNLYVLTGEETIATTRAELATRMDQLLAEAAKDVESDEVKQVVDRVTRLLGDYVHERLQLERGELDLRDIVRLMRPSLSATLIELARLRELSESRVEQANRDALMVNRLAETAGWFGVALLALGLLVLTFGVRSYLLRPILELHRTITRLSGGETKARAQEVGLREIHELAHGVNHMADALERQRSAQLAFISGVAHDLRNPLSGLKMGIAVLERDVPREKRATVGERLTRQVDRLARMVDDLLDAARIEAGELELKREDVDLRGVVQDVVRLYAPTARDDQLVAKLPEEPVIVHCDPLRIEQVVSNLLNNALKFSPQGGSITVSLAVEQVHGIISVADQGIGIAPEELSSIFLPFQRGSPDVAPGAGLGLSVVRRIVSAHNGDIEVDSKPGAGTTFRVFLPLAEREPAPPT